MFNPLVSIIIPSFNRGHIIPETLDSILAQDYSNWECIIVDDGSTDNTAQIVNAYCKKDTRFKFLDRPKHKPKGANACRNYGFELCNGEYIQFLDSDDLLSKNKLSSQLKRAKHTNADIVTCKWGRFTTHEDFKIKESLLYKDYNPAYQLLIAYGDLKSFLPSHVFLVKKEIFLKSGLWNEALKINQDGELFCRVIYQSNSIAFDSNCHVKYRAASDNKTSNLSSLAKAIDLTQSWKLIAEYLNTKDKDKFKSYIDFGKSYAFEVLKVNFKNEIFKNFYFYRNQLMRFVKKKINQK
ncbi:glycosyltransferase family 2 protein [Olleya aquimaris]|uniref:Glycosyl transferase family 2 n=1 Tax=Olleya aquimaris TaxID=639310 RepID=A0A327RJ29_9FLAO|nr:glycosyltransferase family 2 protein [Olleya aquimaris]RAJ16980.1 glycosyl transferase family 2 [Olleya aquimaris]